MIKTQILFGKTIEGNGSLRVRVRVRVRFLLFYSELAPTVRALLGWKKYEMAMSHKHPLNDSVYSVVIKN